MYNFPSLERSGQKKCREVCFERKAEIRNCYQNGIEHDEKLSAI